MTSSRDYSRYLYHDDYYSINTGAHRKGGLELLTPTLTHHLGLWYPPHLTPSVAQRSVEKFGPLVDGYVAGLYEKLRDKPGFEQNLVFHVGNAKVLCLFGGAYHADSLPELAPFAITNAPEHFALKDAIDSDNRILFMKAHWHGLTVIVRCEFHSEYFTITRFATVTNLEDLHESLVALKPSLRCLSALRPGMHPGPVDDSHAYLYQQVWDVLDRELFTGASLFRATASSKQIFADFRGLVLAGQEPSQGSALSLTSFSTGEDRGRPFADEYPLKKLIPSIWPFLTAKSGLDLKRREFTASFMLKKRAVYITALGPQPPADNGFRCAPLHYFLVARPTSDWQLGALVDRLHYMGTVRLAALMELPALRKAGANLRDMEHEAENARKALDTNDTETASYHYRRAMDFIAHTDENKQPIFWAGLQFRVERSRYYVRRFMDFVPFLDIDPIDGYQRYDFFVKGRLGGVYDYIDRLGGRQERAVRSAASLWQSISLLETTETNRQISKANEQSAEANRQSAAANKQNSQISRTIEKLQTKAEIALLAVIVPHYAIEIVRHLQDEWPNSDHTMLRVFVAIIAVGALLACTSLVKYLRDRYKENGWEAVSDVLQKYFVLAVASGFITIVALRL